MTHFLTLLLRTIARIRLNRLKLKRIIVVAGSVGKTSTTQAITHVLRETGWRVLSTRHNYNTNLGIPMSVLGFDVPSNARNPLRWALIIFISILKLTLPGDRYDYVVLELGTDSPGDISQFAWLRPDIAVVTAVTPEHMEGFGSLEAVAKEELSVGNFSKRVVINKSMVDRKFIDHTDNNSVFYYDAKLLGEHAIKKQDLKVIGEHSYDALCAALWVAIDEKIPKKDYRRAIMTFESPPGRMRLFEGVRGSTLIDDTYNSSPEAVIAAIQYMYSQTVNNRIVLLGNMNELGMASKALHQKIGEYCNKTKLDLVVTLGSDANKYTATSAKKNGCSVVTTNSPREAAKVIQEKLKTYNKKDTTLILCKGSQNGVFAEEAVKLLLRNPEDSSYLVRQSKRWKKKKNELWTGV